MDPVAARLASERLAPGQCVSWGQPETSGLPTMDYFLSSALMEPEHATLHYTEHLITLPNLGVHYTPDERVTEICSRPMMGLRDNAVIFWCGQALYKYLPQYDEVFARIASEVGDCQFLFIGFAKSCKVTNLFQSRLRQAFAELGLDARQHCVFVPPMSQERFLGTIRLADIMLDSIGWSGGKSTLDALAEASAIVTCPGPMMRGRHTMAILTRLGVTETIAKTVDDYVSIAVRLAHGPSMRASLRAQVAMGRHRVIADTAPIRALEVFLTQAVEGFVRASPPPVDYVGPQFPSKVWLCPDVAAFTSQPLWTSTRSMMFSIPATIPRVLSSLGGLSASDRLSRSSWRETALILPSIAAPVLPRLRILEPVSKLWVDDRSF